MNFVWPDPRLSASRRAQIAYSRMISSAARIAASSRRLISWIIPATVLGLWWFASRGEWLPEHLTTPHAVLQAFIATWSSGELQRNLATTLCWLIAGYALGAGLGILFGITLGLSRRVEEYFYPTFKAIAYIPVLVWIVLWLALLGIGELLKVVLVAQAAMIPVVFNVFAGIRGIPPELLEVGQVLRLRRGQLLRRIVLPAAFPSIWNGLRVGLTKGWLALVAIEILSPTGGLGFMLTKARSLDQPDLMLVAVISIGLVGYTLHQGLKIIGRGVRDAYARGPHRKTTGPIDNCACTPQSNRNHRVTLHDRSLHPRHPACDQRL
jgi:sulfonate transport system permease protein